MLPASDLDGIDFRPFFDMVVGVLFVLLILIGALLFFEQTQQAAEASSAAAQQRRDWLAQQAQFLAMLAGDLRARGIPAEVDLPHTAVLVPLGTAAKLGANGLPEIAPATAIDLGTVLAQDLRCVSVPREASPACMAFRLLHLNELTARLAVARLPAGAALPQDRFAHLLASLFSAALLHATPHLLGFSNDAGAILLRTEGDITTAEPPQAPSLGGDLSLGFAVAPP